MRIAFNATALLSPLTGIGQYAYELATRMAANAELDVEFFYAVGWSREVRQSPLTVAPGLFPLLRRFVPKSYVIGRSAQDRFFRSGVRRHRPEVYHEPNYLPYTFRGPTVITAHDLSWIRFPQAHPSERVEAMNRWFEPGLRRATLVLTDSEFVRGELLQEFGLPPQRVRAVPLGVSAQFVPQGAHQTEPVLTPLGLTHGRYLLAVGTLEPRKNLVAAIRAHAALPEALQRSHPLVVTGMKGWHTSDLEAEMAPRVAAGRIIPTGYLERAQLAAVTAGATALVYPSIYEGFGLPPLEAMACGVPPIVAGVASLPEVVGDAGVQVAPHDHDALRDAMERLIESPALRAELAQRGIARAAGFSWDRCMAETLAAYRDAIALG